MIRKSGLFSKVYVNGSARIELKRAAAHKMNIISLTFDDFDMAKELVEHVISKYKTSFIASVESEEAAQVLMSAGFRQCSHELLWKIGTIEGDPLPYRKFKKSDAQAAAALYNDELITHFRPSLERVKQEFKNGYILEIDGKPVSYLSVKNSVAEFSNSSGYDIAIDGILAFAQCEFVKLKKYTTNDFEQYLRERSFECVRTAIVLVKDYYKPIKETQRLFSFSFIDGLPSS
jgi:hypothetical protein